MSGNEISKYLKWEVKKLLFIIPIDIVLQTEEYTIELIAINILNECNIKALVVSGCN